MSTGRIKHGLPVYMNFSVLVIFWHSNKKKGGRYIVARLLGLMDKITVTPEIQIHCYMDQHIPE